MRLVAKVTPRSWSSGLVRATVGVWNSQVELCGSAKESLKDHIAFVAGHLQQQILISRPKISLTYAEPPGFAEPSVVGD